MSVFRNDIDDDCIGTYKPMFEDLAFSAKRQPNVLVFGLLPRKRKPLHVLFFFADEIHQKTNIYKGTVELLVVPELALNPE